MVGHKRKWKLHHLRDVTSTNFYCISRVFCIISCFFSAGCMKIKLKAWNTFSSVEVDVDMLATCSKDTDIKEVNQVHASLQFFLFLKFFCILCMFFEFIFIKNNMYLYIYFLQFSEKNISKSCQV